MDNEKEETIQLYTKNIEDKNLRIDLIKQEKFISIKIIEYNNIIGNIYIIKIYLEELQKEKKCFIIIDNINDLFEFFKKLIDENKFQIQKNLDDSYNIKFNFNLFKKEEIEFIIIKEQIDLDKENKNIKNALNSLSIKIDENQKSLQIEINENKKLFEQQNKIISNKTNELETEIKELKKFKDNILNIIKEQTNYFLEKCWPIGSYYWTNNNNSPDKLFGGKWQKIEGKFIYAEIIIEKSTQQEDKKELVYQKMKCLVTNIICLIMGDSLRTVILYI